MKKSTSTTYMMVNEPTVILSGPGSKKKSKKAPTPSVYAIIRIIFGPNH